jgi:hypothetical protein
MKIIYYNQEEINLDLFRENGCEIDLSSSMI